MLGGDGREFIIESLWGPTNPVKIGNWLDHCDQPRELGRSTYRPRKHSSAVPGAH